MTVFYLCIALKSKFFVIESSSIKRIKCDILNITYDKKMNCLKMAFIGCAKAERAFVEES